MFYARSEVHLLKQKQHRSILRLELTMLQQVTQRFVAVKLNCIVAIFDLSFC